MRRSEAIVSISESKEQIRQVRELLRQFDTIMSPRTIQELKNVIIILEVRIKIAQEELKAS